MLVRNKINSRYRGGHPRTYWALGVDADISNETSWSTSLVTGIVPAINTFVTGVSGAAYTVAGQTLGLVIPRYTYMITDDTAHKKYLRERNGLLGVFPVIGHEALVKIGSQRRRLTV